MAALTLVNPKAPGDDEPPGGRGQERIEPDLGALIARAQQGEVAAFERLIATHQRQVYAFALTFTGDPELAKDLAQEALVKTYRSIGSFRFQSSFPTWLFAIVRNVFRDQRRSRAVSEQGRSRPLGKAEVEVAADAAAGAEALLLEEEARQALLGAVRQVPDPYREALCLADLQGQRHEDIARTLRIAVGTVKSRVNRGREALRDILFEKAEKERMTCP